MVRMNGVFRTAGFLLLPLLMTCSNDDSLYTPPDGTVTVVVTAAAVPCGNLDSALTTDTTLLVHADTVRLGDATAFVGRIVPPDAAIALAEWDLGDGTVSGDLTLCHTYAAAGTYTAVFVVADAADLTLSDTVVITVNTPPSPPALKTPDSALAQVDPNTDRLFSWQGFDADGDMLQYVLYLDTVPWPVTVQATLTDTQFTVTAGSLVKLETYFWRVAAIDARGDTVSSPVRMFTTRDPNPAVDGSVAGTITRDGLTTNGGIRVVAIRNQSTLGTTRTDSAGTFQLDHIAGGAIELVISDSVFFKPETLTVSVVNGTVTTIPATVLTDVYPPTVDIILNTPDTVRLGAMVLIHIEASDTLYSVDSIRADYGAGMHRIVMDTALAATTPGDIVISAEAYDTHGNRGVAQRTIHVNTAPSAPQLISPVDWVDLSTGQITMTWTCDDPDAPAGALTYTFLRDLSPDFSSATVQTGLTDTNYVWTATTSHVGTNYWKVLVTDGLDSAESAVDSFRVSTGTGTLTGVVTRQDIGGASNAGIAVVALKGGVIQRQGSTDNYGAYTFFSLSGTVTVRASDYGFAQDSTVVEVLNGVSTAADSIVLMDTLPPVITRTPNSTVKAHQTIQITASAVDTFYSVDSIAVDYGDGMHRVLAVDSQLSYSAPGNYAIAVLATDIHGNTNHDTILIHVNSPPEPPQFSSPASGARVDPNSSPMFTWSCVDTDNPGSLRYDFYMGESPTLSADDLEATGLTSSGYTLPNAGSVSRTLYYQVAAFDGYDTTFSQVDSIRVSPAQIRVYGWVFLEGRNRHNGIRLDMVSTVDDSFELFVDDLGYTFTNVPPATYTLTATDTMRGEFTVASKTVEVVFADSISFDTLVLLDEHLPQVACTSPAANDTLYSITGRDLTIQGTFSDLGSHVDGSQTVLEINGAPVGGVSHGLGTWSYVYTNIPDGRYDLSITVVDSAGNSSDAALRTFSVNCKRPSASIQFVHDTMQCRTVVTDVSPQIHAYYWDYRHSSSPGWDDSTVVSTATGTIAWPLPHPAPAGVDTMLVMVVDVNGMAAFDTVRYTIVQDKPVVSLGNDTVLEMGSEFTFRATYVQQFGHAVAWEWRDIAAGPSWTPGTADFVVTMPEVYVPDYRFAVRMVDDLGVADTDTVVVTVGLDWELVGSAGFTPAVASFDMSGDSSGNLFVAFADSSNGRKARVMYYNGSSWQNFGTPYFSNSWVSNIQMATGQGWGGGGGGMVRYDTRYVAFYDDYGSYDSIRVYSNGSSSPSSAWSTSGTQSLINGNNSRFKLVVSGESPYIGYSDRGNSGTATVKRRFSGGDWTLQGTLTTDNYTYIDHMASSNIVLFEGGSRDTLKQWTGSYWNTLSYLLPVSSGAELRVHLGTVHILDNYSVSGSTRLALKKLVGSSWNLVDGTGLDSTYDYGAALEMASNGAWVAYRDGPSNDRITVKAAIDEVFRLVGPRSFGGGADFTGQLRLVLLKGVPYVAYKDYDSGGGITVYRLR